MGGTTSKILVAGGAPSLVYGNFGRKLEEAGATVGWHVGCSDRSRHATLDIIPSGCEGVIIVKDMTGRDLSNTAKAAAKAANIPYAMVTRKWSEAEPILRATGIILPLPPVPAKVEVTDAAVVTLGAGYVCTQREDGRNPKQEEVNAVLKRAYGEDFLLTEGQFKQIMKEAIERVPVLPAPPPVPEVVPAKVPPTRSEVQLAASMVLGLGVSPLIAAGLDKATEQELRDLVQSVAELGGWEVTQDMNQIVQEVVRANIAPSKPATPSRRETIYAWMVQIWQDVIARKRGYVMMPALRKEGIAKFGSLPRDYWPMFSQARAEVCGTWAIMMDGSARYYMDKAPGRTDLSYESAIKAGLSGIWNGNKFQTSKQAIDEFLSRVAPVTPVSPVTNSTAPSSGSQENIEMEKQIKDQFDTFKIQHEGLKMQNEQILLNQAKILEQQKTLLDSLLMMNAHMLDRFTALSATMAQAPKSAQADGLLALVQAGQIRLVVEPVTK